MQAKTNFCTRWTFVQEEDTLSLDESTISIPTKREPSEQEWKDLKLA